MGSEMEQEFDNPPKLWFLVIVASCCLIFMGISVTYVPEPTMIGLWLAVIIPLLLIIWARQYLTSPTKITVGEEGVALEFRYRWPKPFFASWSEIAWVRGERGNPKTFYGRLESGGLLKFKNYMSAAPPMLISYDAARVIRLACERRTGIAPPGSLFPPNDIGWKRE